MWIRLNILLPSQLEDDLGHILKNSLVSMLKRFSSIWWMKYMFSEEKGISLINVKIITIDMILLHISPCLINFVLLRTKHILWT